MAATTMISVVLIAAATIVATCAIAAAAAAVGLVAFEQAGRVKHPCSGQPVNRFPF